MKNVESLFEFLTQSPTPFHAVDTVARTLRNHGFTPLDPRLQWKIEPGARHYVIKNGSAIFAFIAGNRPEEGWRIIASHSDSPGFRIKPAAQINVDGKYCKLNTEVYGGPILYTWFDRPLSIAGRIYTRRQAATFFPEPVLVDLKTPVATIPHLAIHYNRAVNDGNPLSRQKDMLPVLGIGHDALHHEALAAMLSAHTSIDAADIANYELLLYDTTPPCTIGPDNSLIQGSRLDDLMMVHASLSALCQATGTTPHTRLIAVFDNEETGSATKQGAASPTLHNLLHRISIAMGAHPETFYRAIDNSFLVSADNAHALHPNYVEKQDPTNHPVPGGGPVIKINANGKYMTDAESANIFASVCSEAGVPVQYFVNHSDTPGGSTLGNILTSQIDLRGVDMGAAQWAMHSCRETAGTADIDYTIRAFTRFFAQ